DTGVDIFRIFDALNDVNQIIPAITAVRDKTSAVAEAALCYTGNQLDPAEKLYTLDYYLHFAEEMVNAGAHVLPIKDMAGLVPPAAASQVCTALSKRVGLSLHPHPHDTT